MSQWLPPHIHASLVECRKLTRREVLQAPTSPPPQNKFQHVRGKRRRSQQSVCLRHHPLPCQLPAPHDGSNYLLLRGLDPPQSDQKSLRLLGQHCTPLASLGPAAVRGAPSFVLDTPRRDGHSDHSLGIVHEPSAPDIPVGAVKIAQPLILRSGSAVLLSNASKRPVGAHTFLGDGSSSTGVHGPRLHLRERRGCFRVPRSVVKLQLNLVDVAHQWIKARKNRK